MEKNPTAESKRLLSHDAKDGVFLYYAKVFCGEWVLMTAVTDAHVKTVLRTSGWCYLCDHPLPMDGFQEDAWKWAEWQGLYNPETETFTGSWKGR